MRTPLYSRKINDITVYRNFKKVKHFPKRKPEAMLDTFDKMEPGEYLCVDLRTAKILRAMIYRRPYGVRQTKNKYKANCYRMEKI